MFIGDHCWLAGLVEGEGSFTGYQPKDRSKMRYNFQLTTVDVDVAYRAADLLGLRVHGPYYRDDRPTSRPTYKVQTGKYVLVEYIANLLYPHLGERRQEKLRDLQLV